MNTDIFKKNEMRKLLQGKHIAFFGDSNIRAVYKDFVVLLQKDALISDQELKSKMEPTFLGDRLTHSGVKYNGRDYRENRFFSLKELNITMAFYYLTRIYNDHVLSLFDIEVARNPPDIVFVNSCLWDITRWGPNGVEEYKENLKLFAKLLQDRLSEECLVVWVTAPPISQTVKGGFLVPQLQFLEYSLRFHVAEANYYAAKVFGKAGFDVVDIHYYLTKFLRWRVKDGIHWFPPVVRYITNKFLTHVSLAWGVELPHRIEKVLSCIPPFDDTIFSQQLAAQTEMMKESTEPESMVLETPENSRSPIFGPASPEIANLSPNSATPTKDERTTTEHQPPQVSVFDRLGPMVKKKPSIDLDNESRDSRSSRNDGYLSSHSENAEANNSNFKFDSNGRPLFVLSQNTQNKPGHYDRRKKAKQRKTGREMAKERRNDQGFQREMQNSQPQTPSYVPNFVIERAKTARNPASTYSMHSSKYVSNVVPNENFVYQQNLPSFQNPAGQAPRFQYDGNTQGLGYNFAQHQNQYNDNNCYSFDRSRLW